MTRMKRKTLIRIGKIVFVVVVIIMTIGGTLLPFFRF